jgi:hypothetical protein
MARNGAIFRLPPSAEYDRHALARRFGANSTSHLWLLIAQCACGGAVRVARPEGRIPLLMSPTTMNRKFQGTFLLALAALVLTAACGKYDPGDFDESDDAGVSGRGGRSGSGGRGGTGGGPTATAGRPAPVPTVSCGSATCMAPPNLLAGLPIPTGIPAPVACCVDEESGQCGSAASEDAECEPPATADARCPGIDLGALGMLGGTGMMTPAEPMSGCCTPDDQCGLDGALFGRGCVENDQARMLLGGIPFIGGLIDIPPAQACDAPEQDAGVEDDAGR